MTTMPLVTQIQESTLLRPLWALAAVSTDAIRAVYERSAVLVTLGGLVSLVWGFLRRVSAPVLNALPFHWLELAYLLSFAGLFWAMSVATTGKIGLAVMAVFVLGAVRALKTGDVLKLNVIDLLVGLFFMTAVLAAGFSSYTSYAIVGLGKFGVFFVGYLNFRYFIQHQRHHLPWLLVVLAFIAGLQAVVAFQQNFGHVDALATWQDPTVDPLLQMTRVFGTLQPSNPNLLAGFLLPLLPLVAGGVLLFLMTPPTTQAQRHAQSLMLGLGLALAGAVLATIIMTGSRGGYLSLALMGVMAFMLIGHLIWHQSELTELKSHGRYKAAWILALVAVVGIAAMGILLSPAIQVRLASIFAWRGDSSNAYRITVWTSVLRMIADNWLLGIGPGNSVFKQVYGLYMTPGYNALGAYSVPLEIWAEQGLLGIGSFVLLVITLFARVFRCLFSGLRLQQAVLLSTLLLAVAGSLVYGVFDTIWYRPSVNLLFWMLVAFLSVETEQSEQAVTGGLTAHG